MLCTINFTSPIDSPFTRQKGAPWHRPRPLPTPSLLTLTEVSERTGISMPTLQRYKKEFQDRIPSVGKGRKQRYPADSLDVFQEIKKENIKKRGRPKKSGGGKTKSSGGRKKAAAAKKAVPKKRCRSRRAATRRVRICSP